MQGNWPGKRRRLYQGKWTYIGSETQRTVGTFLAAQWARWTWGKPSGGWCWLDLFWTHGFWLSEKVASDLARGAYVCVCCHLIGKLDLKLLPHLMVTKTNSMRSTFELSLSQIELNKLLLLRRVGMGQHIWIISVWSLPSDGFRIGSHFGVSVVEFKDSKAEKKQLSCSPIQYTPWSPSKIFFWNISIKIYK